MSAETPALPYPYLSISRINLYKRCGTAYWFRYECGLKEPPAWPLLAGSSMDETLNLHHRARIEGKPLPVDYLTDFYRTQVIERVNTEGKPAGDDETVDTVDAGTKVLPVYLREYDPIVEPVSVQHEVKIEVAGEPFLGYIDLVRKDGGGNLVVADHKFVGRKPDARVAATSFQLRLYAREQKTNSVEIVALTKAKRSPEVITVPHLVTEKDQADLDRTVRSVAWAIKNRHFPQTNPANSFVCSPTGCGYWHRCRGSATGRPNPDPEEVKS